MQIVVKTRYKPFNGRNDGKGSRNPFGNSTGKPKDKGMNQYVKYIADGAKTAEKEFEHSEIGREKNYDGIERTLSDMKAYQTYMEYRNGSELLFGTRGMSVSDLKKELLELEGKNHGGCYIPILSMKEKDAIEAGCDTQQLWMENTYEYVEKFAEVVGIPKQNVKFIAAFHLKDEKEQNKEADAGQQPHVHLIIWDTAQGKSNLKMTKKQVNKIRDIADDIWCGNYYKENYQERNDLRGKITNEFLDTALGQMRGRINTLVADISIATNNHGKLNQKALTDNAEMLAQIRNKRKLHQPLKDGEEALMKKFGITNDEQLTRKLVMFNGINKELDSVVRTVLESPEMKPALDQWRNVSLKIKQGKGVMASVQSMIDDEEKMVETLKNRVLRYAKDVIPQGKDAYKVPSGAKQMELLHKVDYMKFKPYVTKEKAAEAIDTIANLMHVYRIPENVANSKMNDLLRRSHVALNPQELERIIREEYANPPVLNSTSYEVGYSMNCLGYDRAYGSEFTRDLYLLYEWRSIDMMTLGYVRKTIDELSFSDIFSTPIERGVDYYQSEYDRAMEEIYEERYAELEEMMAEYQAEQAERSKMELSAVEKTDNEKKQQHTEQVSPEQPLAEHLTPERENERRSDPERERVREHIREHLARENAERNVFEREPKGTEEL